MGNKSRKRKQNRVRYWKREGSAETDRLICPSCGEAGEGLECGCGKGRCFAADEQGQLQWRHSPCLHATCRCGWQGVIRCRSFEATYQGAKCRVSPSSWHDVRVTVIRNETPAPITLEIVCLECGGKGHITFDPVKDVSWVRWDSES